MIALAIASGAIASISRPSQAQSRDVTTPEAESASQIERAKTYFHAGAEAYDAGQYAAAIQAFEEAYRLAPRPQILFSTAQAERKQFYVARDSSYARSAIAHYRTYLVEVASGGRRKGAADGIEELETALGRAEASGGGRAADGRDRAGSQATPRTRIMITSETPGARVSLDGGDAVDAPLVVEVAPGNHRAHVGAKGYFDDDRTVVAVEGTLVPADVALRERPSRLILAGSEGAEVAIDGRSYGAAPIVSPIELAPGLHFVTLTRNGYRAVTFTPRLIHGDSVELRAKLEPTVQRERAIVLLVAGGVGIATGAVCSFVALAHQSHAKGILQDRARANIDASALDDYDASVLARDGWRDAALVAFGIGGGLLATGALLYVFDHEVPPPPVLMPGAPTSEPPPVPTPRKRDPIDVAVAPLVLPDSGGGLVFRGRF